MALKRVQTIDLNFQGLAGTIAVYLVEHSRGVALIESGPASTLPALQQALAGQGMGLSDISDVFLTHIHLDHAGAAGWLARQGARIHVHPVGAPHLADPQKLLASAGRIYGDQLERLWGQTIPVPQSNIDILEDGSLVNIDGLELRAIETPGHASHHLVYLLDGYCFSGDIGGVRMGGSKVLRLPMPPPELHLGLWRKSLARLQDEYAHKTSFSHLAPTHFGIYTDPEWHLSALENALDEIESWLKAIMVENTPVDELRARFIEWERNLMSSQGLDADTIAGYQLANPTFMSADGLHRYWQKVVLPNLPDPVDLKECPRCGHSIEKIIWGMTNCPHCGLHFECC